MHAQLQLQFYVLKIITQYDTVTVETVP